MAKQDFREQARAQLAAEGEDVSVMDVQKVMDTMQQRNRAMFKVPPYILYLARAFSTLEGIGLSANEDYSIVSEAFPYLSKRLLTDSSPRAVAALRSMVYGTDGEGAPAGGPAPKGKGLTQLLNMGKGFTDYSSSTSSVTTAASAEAQGELLDLLLSADGNAVQALLLDEAAKLADAAVREGVGTAANSPAGARLGSALRAPKAIAEATVGRLPLPPPLRDAAMLGPNLLAEMTGLVPALAPKSETDEASLAAFGALWDQLSGTEDSSERAAGAGLDEGAGEGVRTALGRLGDLGNPVSAMQSGAGPLIDELRDPNSRLRTRLPMIGRLSRRFAGTLLRRVATRLEEDVASEQAPELARAVATRAAAAERSIAALVEPER
jgi:hypothetical protein